MLDDYLETPKPNDYAETPTRQVLNVQDPRICQICIHKMIKKMKEKITLVSICCPTYFNPPSFRHNNHQNRNLQFQKKHS